MWMLAPCMLAATLFEVYSLLLIPVLVIYVGWRNIGSRAVRCWTVTMFAIAVTFTLFASTQSSQLGDPAPLGRRLAGALYDGYFFGPRTVGSMGLATTIGVLFVCLVTYSMVGVAVIRGRANREVRLLVAWFVAVPLTVLAGSLLHPALFNERYLAVVVPALACLVGHAATRTSPKAVASACTVAVLACVPMRAAQVATTFPHGDDYRALAALVAKWHPDAAWFDQPAARGVAIAYPAAFHGADDVSLLRGPTESVSLWGISRSAPEARRALAIAHPGVTAVVTNTGRPSSQGEQAMDARGCVLRAHRNGGRYSVAIFLCP